MNLSHYVLLKSFFVTARVVWTEIFSEVETVFLRRNVSTICTLKVSKSQKKLIKSSFLPKYEQSILRISALASKKGLNQKLSYTNYVK